MEIDNHFHLWVCLEHYSWMLHRTQLPCERLSEIQLSWAPANLDAVRAVRYSKIAEVADNPGPARFFDTRSHD
jgi:hypothetical protein